MSDETVEQIRDLCKSLIANDPNELFTATIKTVTERTYAIAMLEEEEVCDGCEYLPCDRIPRNHADYCSRRKDQADG